MCELLTLPLISIGKELGGRDHTTILYSRDKVEEMCRVNDKIAKDVDDIKNIILKKKHNLEARIEAGIKAHFP